MGTFLSEYCFTSPKAISTMWLKRLTCMDYSDQINVNFIKLKKNKNYQHCFKNKNWYNELLYQEIYMTKLTKENVWKYTNNHEKRWKVLKECLPRVTIDSNGVMQPLET